MARALFVSETYLRTYTPIASNVDVDFIFPHVSVFQDTNIQLILGSKLYNGLQDRIIAGTLTPDDQELLDLCRQALAWGATAQLIPFLAVQIRNKGVVENTSDNTASADIDKVRWLQSSARDVYEFYAQRIKDYLCDNGARFAEYTSPEYPIGPSAGSPYSTDLYLGPEMDSREAERLDFWKRWIR